MQFYVQLVRNQGHQVADPLELHDFCDSDQQIATWTLQSLHSHDLAQDLTLFMVPVLARSHWFPLGLQATKGTATLMMPTDVATTVQQLVVDACGPQEVSFETFVMPTDFAADCGFQTVNWLWAKATGNHSPKAVTPAQADQWRISFALQCLQHDQAMTQDLRLGGTLHPDQLLLQSVLKQHGVAQERIADCAANLISKLGHEAIGKALGSSQPWKDLKALATQASPPIRIVLASEIDAAVRARLATDKPMGSKANKTKLAKGPKPPVIPTADQIQLPDSIFVQQDGQKLQAIPVHKVEAHAQGLALCNIHEVLHFLGLTTPISAEGVAFSSWTTMTPDSRPPWSRYESRPCPPALGNQCWFQLPCSSLEPSKFSDMSHPRVMP